MVLFLYEEFVVNILPRLPETPCIPHFEDHFSIFILQVNLQVIVTLIENENQRTCNEFSLVNDDGLLFLYINYEGM